MISFLKKYIRKFYYAFCGLFDGIAHDKSILTQVLIGSVVLLVCCSLSLTPVEWMLVLLVIGGVVALEFVNSAIESIVDLVSPQRCKEAKKIKDYAAAAVLVMSIVALLVAIIIIGGKCL